MEEFESFVWENDNIGEQESYGKGHSRRFVEYCSGKAVKEFCKKVDEKIADGSFGRFTFDVMLAWQMPSSVDEEAFTVYLYVFILCATFSFYLFNVS